MGGGTDQRKWKFHIRARLKSWHLGMTGSIDLDTPPPDIYGTWEGAFCVETDKSRAKWMQTIGPKANGFLSFRWDQVEP